MPFATLVLSGRLTTVPPSIAIRVRPPLRPADPGFDLIPQRFQRSIAHVTSPTSLAVDSPQGRKLFVFDRVFAQDVRQDGVWDYLNESVNAFVQGYNVSILAYGQSGSGKSYTMGTSGPLEQSDPKVMGESGGLGLGRGRAPPSRDMLLTSPAVQASYHERRPRSSRSSVRASSRNETRYPPCARRNGSPCLHPPPAEGRTRNGS